MGDNSYIYLYPSVMIIVFSFLFLFFWFLNRNHFCLIWFSSCLSVIGVSNIIGFATQKNPGFKEVVLVFGIFSYSCFVQSIIVRFRSKSQFFFPVFLGFSAFSVAILLGQAWDGAVTRSPMLISCIAMTAYGAFSIKKHKSSHAFDKLLKSIFYVLSLSITIFLFTNGEDVNLLSMSSIISVPTILILLSFLIVACCMQDGINSMALLSVTDPLTGALNKRSLYDMERKVDFSKMGGVSVFMADIDFFKKINDTYGHSVGDEVIKRFFNIMYRTVRQQDMIFRVGGEEFLVILHPVSRKQSLSIIEMIRTELRLSGSVPLFTVSFGMVMLEDNDLNKAIKRADDLMYESKRNGRNRVTH